MPLSVLETAVGEQIVKDLVVVLVPPGICEALDVGLPAREVDLVEVLRLVHIVKGEGGGPAGEKLIACDGNIVLLGQALHPERPIIEDVGHDGHDRAEFGVVEGSVLEQVGQGQLGQFDPRFQEAVLPMAAGLKKFPLSVFVGRGCLDLLPGPPGRVLFLGPVDVVGRGAELRAAVRPNNSEMAPNCRVVIPLLDESFGSVIGTDLSVGGACLQTDHDGWPILHFCSGINHRFDFDGAHQVDRHKSPGGGLR